MNLTARDQRFIDLLSQRLGARFHDQINAVEQEFGRSGVRRPGGEGRVALYVVHHINGHAAPGDWDWRRVWRFHTASNGWDTGGYNALVDSAGDLWLIVPPSRMSYGAGPKWNPITVHIAALADHQDHPPSEAMLETIWQWLTTCDDVLGYQPWRPHGAIRQTACPGGQLEPLVWEMATRGAFDPRPEKFRD